MEIVRHYSLFGDLILPCRCFYLTTETHAHQSGPTLQALPAFQSAPEARCEGGTTQVIGNGTSLAHTYDH
jgi:hypothetical protein